MATEWTENAGLRFEEGPRMNLSVEFGHTVEDVSGSVVLGA